MADFRYTFEGAEVEAYQITEASRYQDRLWPDWMDSRMFLTIDGQTWLDINGEEKPVPDLGWLIRHTDGRMTLRGAMEFETAVKVVPDVEPVMEELDLDTRPGGITYQTDDKLLTEVTMAFEMLVDNEPSAAEKILRNTLTERTTWCECSPGKCEQVGAKLGCRKHSPLVE